MATIPEHVIQEVRERADIVEIIGRHVGLKRTGKQFKGLCPFHDEKSPSFHVDPNRHSFKCFGCGAWGDVFDFVQRVEGIGFLAALRALAGQAGVALPNQNDTDVRRAEQREREREAAYKLNRLATDLYRRLLLEDPKGAAGREYQTTRAISPEMAERFTLGYAPAPEEAGWDTLVRELVAAKASMDLAEKLGLVARSDRTGNYYDRFRGRLMFPIVQPGGRVIGFSGRVLPQFVGEDAGKAPKYVNSPESLLYKKSKTLFGLHTARSGIRARERVILVEGNVDVVSMHQRGYTETVAPLGTALTDAQCELLTRFTNKVVICFDGDRAGAKAAYEAMIMLLKQSFDVRIVPLEDGEDPDSVEPQRLDNLFERPLQGLKWLTRRMVKKGAKQSIEARDRAVRALIPLLRAVPKPAVRQEYADFASMALDVPLPRLWSAVHEGGPPSPREDSQFPATVPHSAPMRAAQPLPSGPTSLAALLFDRPELARVAKRKGATEQFEIPGDDPRSQNLRVSLEPLKAITNRVIEAALEGAGRPSEGELLEFVPVPLHWQYHQKVFTGEYRDVEDPEAALDFCLNLCRLDRLEREDQRLQHDITQTTERGDSDAARELSIERWRVRRERDELRAQLRRR